jgi:hypothetical protein
LRSAVYTLERDSFRLQWGWRIETIPANEILWVRPAHDLEVPLNLPWIRWPGAMLGTRRLLDDRPVEFLASQRDNLILIVTAERIFAISPSEPNRLLDAYQHLTELGSLAPPRSQSVRATFLFARVWQARPARIILLAGALLCIGLLIWISLEIPQRPQISLGFTSSGELREPLPSIQLMLLPLLNVFTYLFNSTLGFFFYRRDENHAWAYLLWSTSILTSVLFSLATLFILQSS